RLVRLRNRPDQRQARLRLANHRSGEGGPARSAADLLTGSWDIWWGSRGEAASDQEHAEAVVVEVAVAAGDAPVQLDDAVHGLGSSVGGAVGGEVGQERVPPAAQRAAEPRDLGDRATGHGADQCF